MPATRCPTAHELGAALHVAGTLPNTGVSIATARASYELIPAGGLYRLKDFVAAEAMLRRCRLVELQGETLVPQPQLLELAAMTAPQAQELLLLAIVERDPPIWALALSEQEGGLPIEMIPDEDWLTIQAVVFNPAQREEFLLALARRFDSEETAALGAAGEELVLSECRRNLTELGRPDLARRVRRVSLISDQLGYDIAAPSISGRDWRIEVKTATFAGMLARVIISRNEAKVGLSDRGWILLVCARHADRSVEVWGWCRAEAFAPMLPRDPPRDGAWVSAAIVLDAEALNRGLPDLMNGPGC